MYFEPLPGLPAYGDLPKLFGSSVYREGFVVRFLGASAESWVGNFQRGLTGLDLAIHHPNERDVLVIAGGNAYVVDVAAAKVHEEFEGFFTECIPMPGSKDLLLANSGLWIERLGPTGIIWRTRRLSWDGMRDFNVTATEMTGDGWSIEDTWHRYSIDLATGHADGGGFSAVEPPPDR